MRAGALRKRVAIQTKPTALDVNGEPTGDWTTDETVSASITPLSGSEREAAMAIVGIVSHRIEMRYTANATPKKRLLFGTREFGIVSVTNVEERNIRLILMCLEEVN